MFWYTKERVGGLCKYFINIYKFCLLFVFVFLVVVFIRPSILPFIYELLFSLPFPSDPVVLLISQHYLSVRRSYHFLFVSILKIVLFLELNKKNLIFHFGKNWPPVLCVNLSKLWLKCFLWHLLVYSSFSQMLQKIVSIFGIRLKRKCEIRNGKSLCPSVWIFRVPHWSLIVTQLLGFIYN